MTATLPRTAVTTCAVPGRTHSSDDGLRLCRNHLDELAGWLHSIEEEVRLLDARPSMQANWNGSRGGTLASHQSSARIAALVQADPRRVPLARLTDLDGKDSTLSAADTLHRWAQKVRDGRELTISGRLTVITERQLLTRHLEWAAGQPWAGTMWAELRRLRNQLQSVNGTGELRVGGCPECGGRLQVIRPHTTGYASAAGAWVVECDRDVLHRWEGKQLIELRLDLEAHR